MFQQIIFANFSATVVAHLHDPSLGLVYLELLGSKAATHAIWARIVGENKSRRTKHIGDITIGEDEGITIQKEASYKRLETQVNRLNNLAIVHPGLAGIELEPPLYGVYLVDGENDVPTGFLERLQYVLPVPVSPDWAEALWRLGHTKYTVEVENLIYDYATRGPKRVKQQVEQYGLTDLQAESGSLRGYRINTGEVWKEVVKRVLKEQAK